MMKPRPSRPAINRMRLAGSGTGALIGFPVTENISNGGPGGAMRKSLAGEYAARWVSSSTDPERLSVTPGPARLVKLPTSQPRPEPPVSDAATR